MKLMMNITNSNNNAHKDAEIDTINWILLINSNYNVYVGF